MMFPSLQAQNAYYQTLDALHDAVVPRPGGSRWNTRDTKIVPLGTVFAGDQIGHSDGYVRKLLNAGHEKHEPSIRHLVCWLAAGMDPSPLDELEAIAGRIAINIPDVKEHGNVQTELIACIKEFGDVGAVLQEILKPESDGGSSITKKEAGKVRKEGEEAIAKMFELLAVVDEMAQ